MGAGLRLKDWQRRLNHALEDERDEPFAWGSHDCGYLMGAAIRACCGDDHPLLALLKYRTEAGARRLIARFGSIAEVLASELAPIENRLRAQDGDLAIVAGNDVQAGGVVIHGHVMGKSPDGVFYASLETATSCYRVE